MDKWFYKVAVIKGLKKERVPFIISVPVVRELKRLLATLKCLLLGIIWVRKRFLFDLFAYRDFKGVVYYISNRKPKGPKNGHSRNYHRRYKKRWRIEISFRMIKSFMVFTTSKNESVRLFLV